MVPGEVGTAGLQDAKYVARASGSRAFWELLAQALADCNVSAVAVSLNSHCVLDDELPARLEQACTLAAGNADWAVLSATGKCVAGNTYSVVYPLAAPRFFRLEEHTSEIQSLMRISSAVLCLKKKTISYII